MLIQIFHGDILIREFTTEHILRALMCYGPAFRKGEKFRTICTPESETNDIGQDVVTIKKTYRYHLPEEPL